MLDPNFDPLYELQMQGLAIQHSQTVIENLINEIQRLDGLVQEMAKNQLDVTELLMKNQTNIKYISEMLEREGQ
jgi:phosphopantothenate synthetase